MASSPGSASIASMEAAAGKPWRAAKAARRAGSREIDAADLDGVGEVGQRAGVHVRDHAEARRSRSPAAS